MRSIIATVFAVFMAVCFVCGVWSVGSESSSVQATSTVCGEINYIVDDCFAEFYHEAAVSATIGFIPQQIVMPKFLTTTTSTPDLKTSTFKFSCSLRCGIALNHAGEEYDCNTLSNGVTLQQLSDAESATKKAFEVFCGVGTKTMLLRCTTWFMCTVTGAYIIMLIGSTLQVKKERTIAISSGLLIIELLTIAILFITTEKDTVIAKYAIAAVLAFYGIVHLLATFILFNTPMKIQQQISDTSLPSDPSPTTVGRGADAV
jgi:hypothetical protein